MDLSGDGEQHCSCDGGDRHYRRRAAIATRRITGCSPAAHGARVRFRRRIRLSAGEQSFFIPSAGRHVLAVQAENRPRKMHARIDHHYPMMTTYNVL